MNFTVQPIAFVTNTRSQPTDDYWGNIISEIILAPHIPAEALQGIEQFSHLEIIYYFDKANDADMVYAGHPRGNADFPVMGIYAQRKKDRPNKIGLCTVTLVSHMENKLFVRHLDAINGTPILDIKPVMKEFEPDGTIVQPDWSSELMKHYWDK